jgi:PAS domain S-box-containing protein
MNARPCHPVMTQASSEPRSSHSGPRDAQASHSHSRGEALSARRWLILFAPILALAFIAALALAAWLLEGLRPALLVAAAGFGAMAVGLAGLLLYRQARGGEAVQGELQEARARISAIVETAMDAMITVDEHQRIALVNAAAEQLFRWPRAAMIGQKLDMLLPQRFRESHVSHIERFGATGVTSRRMGAQTVLTALRANGEEFPIEASISQITQTGGKFFTVILRDITQRSRAETMLARSEAGLRGILDSAMDAIITVDAAQHVVLFNAAAEAMFGCPRDEAIGAPLAWFIPERFRGSHSEHIRRFGETGTTSRRMGGMRVVTGLRRNGEEFPIDASISQLTEEGKKFYTVILRDITERVRGEQALRRSKEELQLLASAAHQTREHEQSRIARELHDELGQSLTALKMLAVSLREAVQAGAIPAVEKLDRMEAVLDRTVAATRRIAADLRPLMLDDLGLIPAVEWLVDEFSQRHGVRCALTSNGPELELTGTHATAAFRIVQEALTNVARHAQAQSVDVDITRDDASIIIRVRDDGCGFVVESPSRKPDSRGLLGMRERAYLLGGSIAIESAPGRGTAIEVRLPLQAAPETA